MVRDLRNPSVWIVASGLLLSACAIRSLELPADRVIDAGINDVADRSEIVVITESVVAMRLLSSKATRAGYIVYPAESLAGLGMFQVILKIPAGQNPIAAIRELEAIDPSITAGLNHAYSATGSDIPETGRRFVQDLLLWEPSQCISQVAIGLIDTPIDRSHPALATANITGADVTRTGSRAAPDLHGTHMAALLTDSRMLTGTTLFHASAVYQSETGKDAASVDTLMRALDWMITSDVRIVTISLSGPYNKILDRGVNRGIDRGLIIVAAAGNDGPDAEPRYPAAFARTIAVTALDADQRVYGSAARGDHIDFAAPGVEIVIEGATGPSYVSGTSYAAAFVALRIAADPLALIQKTASSVKDELAKDAVDLGLQGADPTFGSGMILAPSLCRSPG